MKSLVTVLAVSVLLCSGEMMSSNEVSDQLLSGDEHSTNNEIQSEAQRTEATVSDQQPCQPDIHTVLRELSVKLTEQSVELRYTENQMEELKKQNEALAAELRLKANEKEVETLKMQNEALSAEIKLKASEKEVETLKTQNEALAAELRLKASEKDVEALKRENEGQALELRTLQVSSNITGSQVRELRRENEYKIAFSASLSTSNDEVIIGPFTSHFTLTYTNVFVNIGNAYNPNTGVFTAPVRGVYMFRFSITGRGSTSVAVGAKLLKNGRHVVIGYCHQPSYIVSTTNGASLLLNVGDVVYMQLHHTSQIFDNFNRYNTFSGQLLFTV